MLPLRLTKVKSSAFWDQTVLAKPPLYVCSLDRQSQLLAWLQSPEAQMLSNFLRFPMVFLSGTFTTLEALPSQLQVVARFLPLTYSVEALRSFITESAVTCTYVLDIVALTLFTIVLLALSTKILEKRIA
jgi:ABC-type multidrug transport system permease subunit